jgi:hypothetical protein
MQNIPIFRVVLELGLSRTQEKLQSIPIANNADLEEVNVTCDQASRTEDGSAAFTMISSNSQQEEDFIMSFSEDRNIQFLQVRGIARVPWMDEATHEAFNKLLDSTLGPTTISTLTDGVDTACFWDAKSFLAGLTDGQTDK